MGLEVHKTESVIRKVGIAVSTCLKEFRDSNQKKYNKLTRFFYLILSIVYLLKIYCIICLQAFQLKAGLL